MTRKDKTITLLLPAHVTLSEIDVLEKEARSVGFQVRRHKIEPKFRTPAEFAMAWAKKGDWECLAEYVEASRMGTGEMRSFLASVLRQEIKKPARRVPTFKRLAGPNGLFERVRFFLSLLDQGMQREHAIDQTAEKFHADRRTIQRNLKEGESGYKLLIWMMNELRRKAAPRYTVCRAALTPHFMS